MIAAGLATLAFAATAAHTDDPSRVELTVKLDVTVKRSLVRKLFVEPCGPGHGIFCDYASERWKRIRLHRGRNRTTVTWDVKRTVYSWVGTNVTGTPWDGYRVVPAPVGAVWVRFGQHGQAQEVVPSPVAHDTLRDVTP